MFQCHIFINDWLKIISNFYCDSTLTHGLFYFLITKDLEVFFYYTHSFYFKNCLVLGVRCWVFVAVGGLSLVAASRGFSLAELCGLLIVVASLVAEHRL